MNLPARPDSIHKASACGALLLTATVHAQCTDLWVPGSGMLATNGTVHCLTARTTGDVVVGGAFTTAGGKPLTNLALYYPYSNSWAPIGDGSDSTVYAAAALPDGDIVAQGTFYLGSGQSSHIARFHPASGTWSPLGDTDGAIRCLAVLPGGDIVAGGTFNHAGGVNAFKIARYDFAQGLWVPMGEGGGVNDHVWSLAVTPDGDVIAGGLFTLAGAAPCKYVARWHHTTNSWSAMGTEALDVVPYLGVLPTGKVIAGGLFSHDGGQTAFGVAQFDEASGHWIPLGLPGSLSIGNVEMVVALPNGDALASGDYSIPDSPPGPGVVHYRHETDSWTAIPYGHGTAGKLCLLPDGGAVASGEFYWNTTDPSQHFARLHLGTLPPQIAYQPVSLAAGAGTSVQFAVIAATSIGTNYQWRKNGIVLTSPTSAHTAVLTLAGVQSTDAGAYDCLVTNSCGASATSGTATLTLLPPVCAADLGVQGGGLGHDGVLDNNDFIAFIDLFFGGCD